MTWYYLPNLSECSNFAPDTEGSPSDSASPELTPEPFVTLSGTPTQRPLSWRGWKTRRWIQRLSGAISQPLTADRGAGKWISSLAGSPASRSPRQARVEVRMTSDGSGQTLPGSLLTWDQDLCSWRTSPDLFDTVFHTSSQTLPTSGSMRNGVCLQRPRLVHPTAANDSGCSPSGEMATLGHPTIGAAWPTPTGMDSVGSGGNPNGTGTHGETLTDAAARNWPTPTARDSKGETGPASKFQSLAKEAKLWPTPKARDCRGGDGTESEWNRHSPDLPALAGELSQQLACGPLDETPTCGESGSQRGDLNPRFVESLMGLPEGWLTPFTSEETDLFLSAPVSLSNGSLHVSVYAIWFERMKLPWTLKWRDTPMSDG